METDDLSSSCIYSNYSSSSRPQVLSILLSGPAIKQIQPLYVYATNGRLDRARFILEASFAFPRTAPKRSHFFSLPLAQTAHVANRPARYEQTRSIFLRVNSIFA